MGKEQIVTIVIGLLVGAALAAGYFFGARLLPKQLPFNKPVTSPKGSPTTQPTPAGNLFTLDNPADNSSTTNSLILISGHAPAQTPIVIFGNADEKIATADTNGQYQAQIKLEEGENEISATMFDSQAKPTAIHRNVTLEITTQ